MRETYYEKEWTLDESGNTTSLEVKGANVASMQFIVTENEGDVSVNAQKSNDGETWTDVGSDVTITGNSSSFISITGRAKYVRGQFKSGTATIKIIYLGGN